MVTPREARIVQTSRPLDIKTQAWKDSLPEGDCIQCPSNGVKITRNGMCIPCYADHVT